MGMVVRALSDPASCCVCDRSIDAHVDVWWNPRTAQVACVSCYSPARPVSGVTPLPAGCDVTLTDDDPAAPAPESLEDLLGAGTHVLGELRIPDERFVIDHLVVALSGVWIVASRNHAGRVTRKRRGRGRHDVHVYVGSRDRTRVVHSVVEQVAAIRPCLSAIGRGDVTVHGAFCLTDSDWGRFSRPFAIDGVWVVWPRKLARWIDDGGVLSGAAVNEIAHGLRTTLSS